MIHFTLLDKRATHEMLGMIPAFLNPHDLSSAREQFDRAYRHGGGWKPMSGWKFDPVSLQLRYPGDQAMRPIATAMLRDERIFIYPHAWVLVMQPNLSFEVARMD